MNRTRLFVARAVLRGWILFFAYLCTLPALLPTLFATAARLEGSHGVDLAVCGNTARVILTHGAGNAGKAHAQIHQHCALARILTAFSTDENGEPDHVVKFVSGTNLVEEDQIAIVEEALSGEVAAPRFARIEKLPAAPQMARLSWPEGAPPNAPPIGLLELKSTLLLI